MAATNDSWSVPALPADAVDRAAGEVEEIIDWQRYVDSSDESEKALQAFSVVLSVLVAMYYSPVFQPPNNWAGAADGPPRYYRTPLLTGYFILNSLGFAFAALGLLLVLCWYVPMPYWVDGLMGGYRMGLNCRYDLQKIKNEVQLLHKWHDKCVEKSADQRTLPEPLQNTLRTRFKAPHSVAPVVQRLNVPGHLTPDVLNIMAAYAEESETASQGSSNVHRKQAALVWITAIFTMLSTVLVMVCYGLALATGIRPVRQLLDSLPSRAASILE